MARLSVAMGNRALRAKKHAIMEIIDAMYDNVVVPDDKCAVVRRRLLMQLKYGEDLRPFVQHVAEQISDDPGAAIAALAVFPLEHLAVRKTDVSCLKSIPRHKRRYGLWLSTRMDNLEILVALTRYVGQFVFRDAVLDRLCGYPVAPPPPPQLDQLFRDGLNQVLVDTGRAEIQQWVECPEPVDIASYRDLGVAELDEVKWCAKSGNLTIRGEFRVTSNMLQRVPKVTLMLTEEEVSCATLAMHHGVLPYGSRPTQPSCRPTHLTFRPSTSGCWSSRPCRPTAPTSSRT